MKIMYIAGPANVYGTYKKWKENVPDENEVAVTYSKQFFNSIKKASIKAVVISWDKTQEEYEIKDGDFVFINKYMTNVEGNAIKFNIGQYKYFYFLCEVLKKHKVDVIVATGGIKWYMFFYFKLLRKKIIISLHNLIWERSKNKKIFHRVFDFLGKKVINRHVDAALSLSVDTTKQLKEILKKDRCSVVEFSPFFNREYFQSMKKAKAKDGKINVLFSGRIERDKGVYDLVEVIENVIKKNKKYENIKVDICGTGSCLEELKNVVKEKKLENFIFIHGHIVIVPTRSTFSEGFNKVVIEGTLSGAIVIASDSCSLDSIKSKNIYGVKADNVEQYIEVLTDILEKNEYFEVEKEIVEFFTNYKNSWEYAFSEHILKGLLNKKKIESRFIYE